jgi:hypothetical protein
METEKLNVVFAEGQKEAVLTILEGKAQNRLEVKPPLKINIIGTIGAPVEFLKRRFSHCKQSMECETIYAHFDHTRCHVLINRENVSITLVTDEHDEYKKGVVVGTLSKHPKFEEFGINSGKCWEPNALGQFLKMNRAFFPDKAKNMSLVTELKNFEANVNSKIEKQRAETGDFKENYSGVVTSNLPELFSVKLPLFKGVQPDIFDVEFYAYVSGKEVSLQLVSPGANELFELMRDKVIDEQIEKIREIAENIVIIEQ